MDSFAPSNLFMELPFYSAHFMDVKLWEPFVCRVVSQHGYECQSLSAGFPGTFPTFVVKLVGMRTDPNQACVVVKFFGPLFEGNAALEVEKSMGSLLSNRPMSIPSPAILAHGQLSDQWHYLLFEYIPGVSLNQVRQALNVEQLATIAQQIGRFMKELHQLPVTMQTLIPTSLSTKDWEGYTDFLENQRSLCWSNHARWQDLPAHLIDQLPGFIPQVSQLIDLRSPPHLIHTDLTGDHVLGRFTSDNPEKLTAVSQVEVVRNAQSSRRWENLSIIDWGDSRVGNILYELVALHLDLFQSDLNLLRLCLDAYDLPLYYRQGFSKKALSVALLHQFPLPGYIKTLSQDLASLDILASQLFAIE